MEQKSDGVRNEESEGERKDRQVSEFESLKHLTLEVLTYLQVREVSEFRSPKDSPLCYPGDRAGHSFVTDGEIVMPLAYEDPFDVRSAIILKPGGIMKSLDAYLESMGAAPAGERYAVMGYGSNASPGALKSKNLEDRNEKEIVPVINARIRGWDAVYNFMSLKGYAYAELMPEESTGLDVVITLLDKEQIQTMNESEPNYLLSVFPGIVLETGEAIDAYGYAGTSKIFVPEKSEIYGGKPVAVKEIPAENRELYELYQTEVLSLAIEEFGLEEKFGISTPEDLSEIVVAQGRQGSVLNYIKDAVANGRPLNNSIADGLEQVENPLAPTDSLDDMLKGQLAK